MSSGWRGTRGARRTAPVSWWRLPDGKPTCPRRCRRCGRVSCRWTRSRWSPPTPRRAMRVRSPRSPGRRRCRSCGASLRHHHFGVDPAEAPGREPNGLTQGFDGDGRYRLRAVLDADEGAIVRQALQEAHDALFHTSDGRVSGADALVEMARRSLATVTPLARRDAFVAVFHVPVGSSPGHLHGGPVLPDRLRRQLLCDGRGVVVGVRHGRPVDLGRSTRIVPTRLRQLIEERDRGCRVPGCTATRVQIHHVRHWEDGGVTAPSNLVVAVPPPPSVAPRWRPTDRRRPRAVRRSGVRRSLRPSRRVQARPGRRALDESRVGADDPGDGHVAPSDGRAARDEVDRLRRPARDSGTGPAGVIRGKGAPVRSAR